jgi:hypothetical protein
VAAASAGANRRRVLGACSGDVSRGYYASPNLLLVLIASLLDEHERGMSPKIAGTCAP